MCVVLSAVCLILQTIILGSMPGSFASNNAVVQKTALRHLQAYLSLRTRLGEGVVGEVVQRGLIDELVALVKPGTDAREWVKGDVGGARWARQQDCELVGGAPAEMCSECCSILTMQHSDVCCDSRGWYSRPCSAEATACVMALLTSCDSHPKHHQHCHS